jgi:hypothetical protein
MTISIPKSGLYQSNRFARNMLEALIAILGENGLNTVYNRAGLPELIENFPPDNYNKEFDFASIAAIDNALEDLYGVRGGRGLALRAGKGAFNGALRNYGALGGVASPEFQALPLANRVRIGLAAIARVFSQTSDQECSVEDKGDVWVFHIHRCPACWGRTATQPICNLSQGMLVEGLKWVSGGKDFEVTEVQCVAMGAVSCDFSINKEPN